MRNNNGADFLSNKMSGWYPDMSMILKNIDTFARYVDTIDISARQHFQESVIDIVGFSTLLNGLQPTSRLDFL